MTIAECWQLDGLDEFIEDLLERLEVRVPPVDPLMVARSIGLEVQRNRDQVERGRLRQRTDKPVIVVRPEPRWERSCWTVAHEIGEFLMPRIASVVESDMQPQDRELLANEFANRLLVPLDWLRELVGSGEPDLYELKSQFRTASYEVIAFQLLRLARPLIVTIFDQGRPVRRRSNLPIRPPRISPLEQEAFERANKSGRPASRRHDIVSSTAWPIHETGWKREIILTTLDRDEWS